MALDGILFRGAELRIRRPKDYVGTHTTEQMLSSIPDSPYKIFIGGLPSYVTDDQLRDLLNEFGPMKAFNLVRDGSGQSKGFAFVEFADPGMTDVVCQGLNGMQLGEKRLVVQRASVGRTGTEAGTTIIPGATTQVDSGKPTHVVMLLNLFDLSELEADYDGL